MRKLFVLVALLGCIAFQSNSWAVPCSEAFSGAAAPQVSSSPKLIILSAPSGGGKTTLAQLLLKEFPNLTLSVSTTTRAPRGQEKNGLDYHFLSVPEFKTKIARGDFAEHAEVHGNFYGTDKSNILGEFAQGHSVLALVDVKGAEKLREAFPNEIYTIFISPPDMKTLEERLRGRGTDPEEAIQKRLKNAKEEMAEASRFDRVVINGDLDTAKNELISLLRSLRLVP